MQVNNSLSFIPKEVFSVHSLFSGVYISVTISVHICVYRYIVFFFFTQRTCLFIRLWPALSSLSPPENHVYHLIANCQSGSSRLSCRKKYIFIYIVFAIQSYQCAAYFILGEGAQSYYINSSDTEPKQSPGVILILNTRPICL